MDLYDAIRTRRSVRAYADRPVEADALARVLEAGRLAPSARNLQSWKLVVVRDAATRQALAEAAEQAFVAQAPVAVAVVAADPHRVMHCGVEAGPVDAAIVADHLTLAATAEGLGSCWICHFDQDRCRQILGVPETNVIVTIILLGHAATDAPAKKRKDAAEIIRYERFS